MKRLRMSMPRMVVIRFVMVFVILFKARIFHFCQSSNYKNLKPGFGDRVKGKRKIKTRESMLERRKIGPNMPHDDKKTILPAVILSGSNQEGAPVVACYAEALSARK
ncbi:hypothetical protein L596_011980 [Steinernema carpocapsae]|uniref:Uncharacterized protein n=1 Tax=Steinernema carpocapsae TaxID=34508 RepID=A0A4U5NVL9_STECR|nr:hypothetical protein L596_011980 [Steinernema carpocapsae]